MRAITRGLCIALIATLSSAPAGAARTPRCAAGMETIYLLTLKVEAEPGRDSYRLGETARIKVTVTRPAEEDPLGQGIPLERPTAEPAPDVDVGVGLRLQGGVFLPGFTKTGEEGEGLVSIRIAEYAKPGAVSASVFAEKIVGQETPCLVVKEQGYSYYPELFTVTKD